MDIRLKATDITLTTETNAYTEDRLVSIGRMLGEASNSARCEVDLGRAVGHSKHGDVWFAEINLHTPEGGRFFAREEAESIHAAVDAVKDEILAQLRKSKKAGRGALRRSGAFMKRLLRRG